MSSLTHWPRPSVIFLDFSSIMQHLSTIPLYDNVGLTIFPRGLEINKSKIPAFWGFIKITTLLDAIAFLRVGVSPIVTSFLLQCEWKRVRRTYKSILCLRCILGPPKIKKKSFSQKNTNSVICPKMGGSQGSGPSHPDGVGPLGVIR